ncbi:MAG: alkaline phosphatase family protein [Thermoanaerobaculia bacterium]
MLAAAPPPRASPGRLARAVLLASLPGWLAGALLTGLLFFLNPALDFSAPAVARGVACYGLLLAALSALVVAGGCRLDAARVGRALPWAMTGVLALTALLAWYHASHYSYFLPPGIGTRLIKAAVLVSTAALIAFYTALLHSLNDRPYGRRSRWGLALAALAAVYFMLERREAFAQRPEATPLPATVDLRELPRLYVVGLEGATLDAILPLAGEGQLPFFADALAEGAYGRLGSVPPVVTPAVWTTLASGKLPFRHGVLGRQLVPTPLAADEDLTLLPARLGFARWGTFGAVPRPLDGNDRRALTLWEMLARLDLPSGAVGWPASWPAQGPTAFVFSDRYFYGELEAAAAVPPDLVERGSLFRVGTREIDPRLLAEIGRPRDRELLEGALASDLWRQALARFLLAQAPDLRGFFLRLTGLGHVSRASFGGFAAVVLEGSRRRDDQAAAAELTTYYRWLDRWLAEFWAAQPAPKILAVVSPHGFAAPTDWRRMLGVGGARQQGRLSGPPDGLILLLGEGVQPGRLLTDPELADVVPTLLYALGLPSARDFDGRVLTETFTPAFLARQPLAFVPSYETLLPAAAPP